jgi:DNA-binding YbaB/EbfC family protein
MMNVNALMKQAQKLQEEMQRVQDILKNIFVEGVAGGGMVKVMANCNLEIVQVSIEPEIVDASDKEMLEDLVTAAVNQAIQAAQVKANEEMQKVTGGVLSGLNLPGNFKFPGM